MCGHHWSHMIIRLLIVLFIFWAGMEFGEVRELLRSGYGGPVMMMNEGGYGGGMRGYGMMGGSGMGMSQTSTVSPAVPIAPTTQAQ